MNAQDDRQSVLFVRLGNGLLWLLGHAPKVLPVVVIGLVGILSWSELRAIHPRDVRAALHSLDPFWLLIAACATLLNIGVMAVSYTHLTLPTNREV